MKRRTVVIFGFAAIACVAAEVERPRVFVTESPTPQATAAGAAGTLAFTGGSSPQSVEVMKAFSRGCPNPVITSNREKADYILRLDHEAINPTTPFTHGNKVAVFDKRDDLIFSDSNRLLKSAVRSACAAITRGGHPS